MKDVLFVAIDVDDNSFHACGVTRVGSAAERNKAATPCFQFRCKPDAGVLARKLREVSKGAELKLCYEATYLGFSLQRDLKKKGFSCEVIAPSLVPQVPGNKVKTDKLDSVKLATFYSQGLLTAVQVPTETQEHDRDLIRSRNFLKDQVKSLKTHITSMCRRRGLNYKFETSRKTYWDTVHWRWLQSKCAELPQCAKYNLSMLLTQLQQNEATVKLYDTEIAQLSTAPEYEQKVKALRCFRGVDTQSAMTLITELGDINRFDHPSRLASYAGMDIQEYSSGGKERRYHITKMGNRYIRTAAVECMQRPWSRIQIGKTLTKRREGAEYKYVEVADRCMKRLNKKSTRMLYAGKSANKIKVACAREFLCFVWESLRLAA